jgi:outer membrane protein assembly factor BamB
MMPMPRIPARHLLAAAALILFGSTVPVGAVSSRFFRQRDRADFELGEPKGVSLSVEGPIRLGALLEPLYEPEQPYIWALAAGPRGVIYAAGGNDGVVYRLEPGGKPASFLTVDEAEVHALAVDDRGNIFAGTAPGGRVYKFAPDGKRIWDCDTGEKYVWALALDRKGGVYAGTGTDGRLVAIDSGGAKRILYDSAETHVRALALDAQGNLLAGTDGHGLVIRIAPDGRATVLYDAPLTEIVALAPAPDGTLYVAAAGEAGRGQSAQPASGSHPPGPGGGTSEPPRDSSQPPPQTSSQDNSPSGSPAEQRITLGIEGKVLAVSPDGYGREIWAAGQEAILSLALRSDGSLLMGSGSQGRIYALDTRGNVSEIARSASSQVTSLARRHDGSGRDEEVLVGGSNLGSVALLRSGYAPTGDYESRVFDAQSFATWGRLSWKAERPQGTEISFRVRTGNTEDPDATWSDWSGDLTDAAGAAIDRPSARFLQWRATLRTTNPARTPELREVTAVYMQKNLPPEFRKIEALPTGVSLQSVPSAPPGQPGDPKPGASDDTGIRRRPKPQSRRGFDPGARSVQWQAGDPNDDDLVFDVQYRALDETAWKTIRRGVAEDFVTFDGNALPDGTYLVRVVASDAPSNPGGQALTSEKISPAFDVDNTPPRIERLKAGVEKGGLRVSFDAVDGFSVLRDAAVSVDAGDWSAVRPQDGLHDALTESYDVLLPSPGAGEHSVVVRVFDAAGNAGSGRVVLTAP